jgi:hypothetical protein
MKTNFINYSSNISFSVMTILQLPTLKNYTMKTFQIFLIVTCTMLLMLQIKAQSPIVNTVNVSIATNASFSYAAKGATGSSLSGNNYNYTFGAATQASNNQKQLVSMTIGNEVYTYAQQATSFVKIRRVNNVAVTGMRSLLWVEKLANATNTKVAVVPKYNDNMESVFAGNSLNQGTDNLFANQGDGNGNNNNIERLDVIFAGGIISTTNNKVGFALFERGNDNEHDPFVIAAITAVDQQGNPTAYGAPLRISTSNWGNIASSATNYYVVRKDAATDSTLKISTSGTQNIGGVFISFNHMGIASGTKIYGYSIMAYDLPASATAANLVDYTNTSYFPRNTSSATSQGGIDLIALTGVLSTPEEIILPPTANNIKLNALMNTAPATALLPLEAIAATGSIATFIINTIPSASQGVLYMCTNNNCVPVVAGQILTPAEINSLSFKPNVNFTGDVVFNYSATDTHSQYSNIATYTIPVISQTQNVLPVSLLSFKGSISNKKTQLVWQTSLEINSSYFEIQRSTNAVNFEAIATVTAKGNSAIVNNYQTTDDLFFFIGSKVFYRLKMVDTDGKFKYSQVLAMPITAIVSNNITAWPLPFSGQLSTGFKSESNGSVKINITNINGALVLSNTSTVQKGYNTININQAQSIPSGTYLLTVVKDGKSETIKVVKQ